MVLEGGLMALCCARLPGVLDFGTPNIHFRHSEAHRGSYLLGSILERAVGGASEIEAATKS